MAEHAAPSSLLRHLSALGEYRPFKRLVFVVVSLLATSVPILCQSVQEQLSAEFKGKTLLLRNFYSGEELTYDENGRLLGVAEQGPWTLANIKIDKVAVTTQGIEIRGNRMGALYKNGNPTFIKLGKLNIRITRPIASTDSEATLHAILNRIFIEPGEDLRAMMPDYWQSYFCGNDEKSRSTAWRAALPKESWAFVKSHEVTAPRTLSSLDPRYTKEAAEHGIGGVSILELIVGVTGNADNITVLQPLGMGLDEQAVAAVRQWRFQPAMRNGQPVRVEIRIEINFRCCR